MVHDNTRVESINIRIDTDQSVRTIQLKSTTSNKLQYKAARRAECSEMNSATGGEQKW